LEQKLKFDYKQSATKCEHAVSEFIITLTCSTKLALFRITYKWYHIYATVLYLPTYTYGTRNTYT
jgi:hypothetical protein